MATPRSPWRSCSMEHPMTSDYSTKTRDLLQRLQAFFDQHIYPNEERYLREVDANRRAGNAWIPSKVIDELKPLAQRDGLWNLFLPHPYEGQGGISNLDYAPLCELMGRVMWSGEVFNCSAPDTGNMETLESYATDAQKQRWLKPLLAGEIRSALLMTEPAVASSDATNIQCTIRRDGDDYVVNGRKWFSSGAGNPRCAIFIVMGKTDPDAPRHAQQSMVLVPRDAKGVTVVRPLTVFGYDDAPHGHMEVAFDDVRVPVSSILLGEGRGFEIAQGRLGPGRIHHCMRLIGMAERALELMCTRTLSREAFGKPIAQQGVVQDWIAESRVKIELQRLLVLKTAWLMETVGHQGGHTEIQTLKIPPPIPVEWILDRAIQAHGAGGVSQDFPLAALWAGARTLRLADGPDEVHKRSLANRELKKYR